LNDAGGNSSILTTELDTFDDDNIISFKTSANDVGLDLDSEDPFRPRAQLVNSPAAKQEMTDQADGIKMTEKAHGPDPHSQELSDPFKLCSQLPNSPDQPKANCVSLSADEDLLDIQPPFSNDANESSMTPAQDENDAAALPDEGSKDPTHGSSHVEGQDQKAVAATELMPSEAAASSKAEPKLEADPFKPSSQIANTPVKREETEATDVDPFQCKKQLANSPVQPNNPCQESEQAEAGSNDKDKSSESAGTTVEERDACKSMSDCPVIPEKGESSNSGVEMQHQPSVSVGEDQVLTPSTESGLEIAIKPPTDVALKAPAEVALKTSAEVALKPSAEVVPVISGVQPANTPAPAMNGEEVDSANTDCQKETEGESATEVPLSSASANSHDADSFKPSEQPANSLAVNEEEDPFKPKTQLSNTPQPKYENPKTQLPKSPQVALEEDSFKPHAQLMNSPAVGGNVDTTRSQLACSPKGTTEEEPFKPSTQLANSPKPNLEEADPFRPSVQIPNSPQVQDDKSPVKVHLTSSPTGTEEETDPFKSKAQLPNSPKASNEEGPCKPKVQLPNSPSVEEETDPFKSKTQLPNSPKGNKGEDPFKSEKQLPNSPNSKDVEDPFKPKLQLPNSPTVEDELDPFKSKTQLPNSPKASNVEDPFKSKTQLANSPAKTDGQKEPDSTSMDNSMANSSKPEEKPKADCAQKEEKKAPAAVSFDPLVVLSSSSQGANNPVFLASGDDLGLGDGDFVSGSQGKCFFNYSLSVMMLSVSP
jgi:hypothetical protein